jgi:hypothetical protein
MENFIVSYIIPLAYLALGIAALGAVVFPVIQMLQDLKKAKTALIGVGAVVVLFVICYLLADNQPFTVKEISVTGGQMKMVEASIFTFYILLTGSIVAILYSSVSRYFK